MHSKSPFRTKSPLLLGLGGRGCNKLCLAPRLFPGPVAPPGRRKDPRGLTCALLCGDMDASRNPWHAGKDARFGGPVPRRPWE
jgi:hypothetical protein